MSRSSFFKLYSYINRTTAVERVFNFCRHAELRNSIYYNEKGYRFILTRYGVNLWSVHRFMDKILLHPALFIPIFYWEKRRREYNRKENNSFRSLGFILSGLGMTVTLCNGSDSTTG